MHKINNFETTLIGVSIFVVCKIKHSRAIYQDDINTFI